ncbi:hypothetical protein EDB19DRAFT_1906541 [Suillus lakei]|nr:hypothetical protein EDB19DRAFT_1906541 [Suillus lakei]
MSALLVKGYAYHSHHTAYLDSLRDNQRLLLFRLIHTINREQELAAPMVISYLMGWGDTYHSHHYSLVHWSSFISALLKDFPALRCTQGSEEGGKDSGGNGNTASISNEDANEDANETNLMGASSGSENNKDTELEENGKTVTLSIDRGGRICNKCQVTDYCLRGHALEKSNVISFFTDTYEAEVNAKTHAAMQSDSHLEDVSHGPHPCGRPHNEHVQYLSTHPKHSIKQCIVHSQGHNTLPNFIGPYFPCQDDPEIYPFYCASMLLLLKPWGGVATDLKSPEQTWQSAFEEFYSTASQSIQHIVSGIQYFYQCETLAQNARDSATELISPQVESAAHTVNGDFNLEEDAPRNLVMALTEEGLQSLIASQLPM